MARPTKCRQICHCPDILEFYPATTDIEKTPIILTLDEYETIRLIDQQMWWIEW